MDAPSCTLPFQAEARPTTTSERPSPTRSAIGLVFSTPSREDAPALVTALRILQPNLPHLRAAQLDVILAQEVDWTQSPTTWITHTSKYFFPSERTTRMIDELVLTSFLFNSSCYRQFTAGQQTRMYNMYSTYRTT